MVFKAKKTLFIWPAEVGARHYWINQISEWCWSSWSNCGQIFQESVLDLHQMMWGKRQICPTRRHPPPFCWLNSLLLNFLYPCCDIMNSPIILEKWNNLYKSEMVKPVTKVHPPSSPEISVVFSLSTKILRRWLQNLRYQISCYHVLSSVIFLINYFIALK